MKVRIVLQYKMTKIRSKKSEDRKRNEQKTNIMKLELQKTSFLCMQEHCG